MWGKGAVFSFFFFVSRISDLTTVTRAKELFRTQKSKFRFLFRGHFFLSTSHALSSSLTFYSRLARFSSFFYRQLANFHTYFISAPFFLPFFCTLEKKGMRKKGEKTVPQILLNGFGD